uniref:Putative homeobox transcription factor sip1 n=1 Tax=Ixodes ricinus TaxID=34613 RepID=A0A147BTS9_IXORI
MFCQTVGMTKGFQTLLTLVRLFTCVCSIVVDKVAIPNESLGALFALVRFFTCVCSIVLGQTATMFKVFEALFAPVRFFCQVCLNVVGQVSMLIKSCMTVLALVDMHTSQTELLTQEYSWRGGTFE